MMNGHSSDINDTRVPLPTLLFKCALNNDSALFPLSSDFKYKTKYNDFALFPLTRDFKYKTKYNDFALFPLTRDFKYKTKNIKL